MTTADLIAWVNWPFVAWLAADWPVALGVSIGVQLACYLVAGSVGWWLTRRVWPAMGFGREIDSRPPKPGQLKREIFNGIQSCVILAVASLSYPWLCKGIWPEDLWTAAWQLAAFVVFNNVYSYATHRLLHTKALIRFHGVHHRSVRVTPFSSYSVHAVEAVVIAGTLPLFMLIVPLGVAAASVLHIVGMVYTTCIHSNYDLMPALSDEHWFKKLINHPTYHRHHHTLGNVNYGFTNRVMDILFATHKD